MRLKIANAVEGCWYSLLKVVPGSCSRYSNERKDEVDMVGGGRARPARYDVSYLIIAMLQYRGCSRDAKVRVSREV